MGFEVYSSSRLSVLVKNALSVLFFDVGSHHPLKTGKSLLSVSVQKWSFCSLLL